MKAANASPGYYGAYPNFYPSPIGGSTDFPDSSTSINWAAPSGLEYFADPTQILPGSIGEAKYYINTEGPFKGNTNAYKTIDTGKLFSDYTSWNSVIDAYNILRNEYEPLRETYDAAVKAEKERKVDLIRMWFSALPIPTKPCKPD